MQEVRIYPNCSLMVPTIKERYREVNDLLQHLLDLKDRQGEVMVINDGNGRLPFFHEMQEGYHKKKD